MFSLAFVGPKAYLHVFRTVCRNISLPYKTFHFFPSFKECVHGTSSWCLNPLYTMPWSTCTPFHFFNVFWSNKLMYVPITILWLNPFDLYMQKRIPWSFFCIQEGWLKESLVLISSLNLREITTSFFLLLPLVIFNIFCPYIFSFTWCVNLNSARKVNLSSSFRGVRWFCDYWTTFTINSC